MKKFISVIILWFFSVLAITSASANESEEARSFIQNAAGFIYTMAWPTATFEKAEIHEIRPVRGGGVDIRVRFSGTSAWSDDELWMILKIAWRNNTMDDFSVEKHNAILAEPFSTLNATASLASELLDKYSEESHGEKVIPQWRPGQKHPSIANVVAGSNVGIWIPADGYRWSSEDRMQVVWYPGERQNYRPNVVASTREGFWQPASGYVWHDKEKWTVRWASGVPYNDNAEIVSTSREGYWLMKNKMGFNFEEKDGFFYVTSVFSGGPAERAGLQNGWILLSMGEHSLRGISTEQYFELPTKKTETLVLWDPVEKRKKTVVIERGDIEVKF